MLVSRNSTAGFSLEGKQRQGTGSNEKKTHENEGLRPGPKMPIALGNQCLRQSWAMDSGLQGVFVASKVLSL